jgi:tetraacyldisaccharide 4'-kinase
MRFKQYIEEIVEDRRQAPGFLKLFAVVSYGYRLGVAVRNFLYDHHWLKSLRVDAVVVSIGNIVCGGTGKTPLIQMLAEEINQKITTAIITRGYRSEVENSEESIQVSDGKGPFFSARQCGDETFVLAKNTRSCVFAGKSKWKSALLAEKKGCKVLLVDDGMQHRKLQKDVEIVIIDGNDPWGGGYFLPRGRLRDSPKRLAKADLVVVGYVPLNEQWQKLKAELKMYTDAPLVCVDRKFALSSGEVFSRVGIFCGIAKPHYFEAAVKSNGIEIVGKLFSSDHVIPSFADLQRFAKECKAQGAQALICTEKDFVKLSPECKLDLPIVILRLHLEIIKGLEAWQNCLENIVRKGLAFSKKI